MVNAHVPCHGEEKSQNHFVQGRPSAPANCRSHLVATAAIRLAMGASPWRDDFVVGSCRFCRKNQGEKSSYPPGYPPMVQWFSCLVCHEKRNMSMNVDDVFLSWNPSTRPFCSWKVSRGPAYVYCCSGTTISGLFDVFSEVFRTIVVGDISNLWSYYHLYAILYPQTVV